MHIVVALKLSIVKQTRLPPTKSSPIPFDNSFPASSLTEHEVPGNGIPIDISQVSFTELPAIMLKVDHLRKLSGRNTKEVYN